MVNKIFIAYTLEDSDFLEPLQNHLAGLERQGIASTWHDQMIQPGQAVNETIALQMADAEIIIMLLSADFIANDFCYGTLVTTAVERHTANKALLLPVVVRHCDWQALPFGHLRALPNDAGQVVPISDWPNLDKAWMQVVDSIRKHLAQAPQKATPVFSNPVPPAPTPYVPIPPPPIVPSVSLPPEPTPYEHATHHDQYVSEPPAKKGIPIWVWAVVALLVVGVSSIVWWSNSRKSAPREDVAKAEEPLRDTVTGPKKPAGQIKQTNADKNIAALDTARFIKPIDARPVASRVLRVVLVLNNPTSCKSVWVDGKEVPIVTRTRRSVSISLTKGRHEVEVRRGRGICAQRVEISQNEQEVAFGRCELY